MSAGSIPSAPSTAQPIERPPAVCSSTELTTDSSFLALMLVASALAFPQWLSGEQWQLMSELSGFDGHRALPRLQPLSDTTLCRCGAALVGQPTDLARR